MILKREVRFKNLKIKKEQIVLDEKKKRKYVAEMIKDLEKKAWTFDHRGKVVIVKKEEA